MYFSYLFIYILLRFPVNGRELGVEFDISVPDNCRFVHVHYSFYNIIETGMTSEH